MLRLFIPISLLFLSVSTTLSNNNRSLFGVWSGSIGKYEITACFNYPVTEGNYYYQKYGIPIQLDKISNEKWSESDSIEWKIESITSKSITGKWCNLKNNVTLPIHLSYVATCFNNVKFSESPCRCDVDSTPIFGFSDVSIDTTKKSDVCYYHTLNMEANGITVEWFELLGRREIDKKINVLLNGKFPNNRVPDEYFEQFEDKYCEDHKIKRPFLWTERFLVVFEAHNWFCQGVNHDQSEIKYRTFDFSTGEEIDMKSWQSWIEYKYLSEWGVGEKLNKLILSKYPKEKTDINYDDCLSMYDQETQYKVRLDKDGIAFYTESPLGNCNIEFIVTFQELEPFLSDKGKKIIKILSDNKDTDKIR